MESGIYMVIRSSIPPKLLKFLVLDTNYSNTEEIKPYSIYFQESVYIYQIDQSVYSLRQLIIFVDLEGINSMLLKDPEGDNSDEVINLYI